MTRLCILILVSYLSTYVATAQQVLTDSVYASLVLTHNPFVKQLGLLMPVAESEIQSAKGSFDPKAYGEFEQNSSIPTLTIQPASMG